MKRKRLTREEGKQQTKERLLEAALEVFSRYGYEGASVDRIADHAGYTKGAFYSNFPSKDEILLAVLQEHTRRELVDLEELVQMEADRTQLLDCLAQYYESSRSRVDAGMLMAEFQLQSARDPKFAKKFIPVFTQHQESLSLLLNRALGKLSLDLESPQEFIEILMALSVGIALQKRSQRSPGGDSFGRVLRQILGAPGRGKS